MFSEFYEKIRHWHTVIISFYIGIALNLPVFYRKYYSFNTIDSSTLFCDIGLSTGFSLILLSISVLLHHMVYKITAGTVIIFSAIATYYMTFFDVTIGYGIIQAVLDSDIAFSLESADLFLVLFTIFFGFIPSFILIKNLPKEKPRPLKSLVINGGSLATGILTLLLIDSIYEQKRGPLQDGRIPTNPLGVAAHSYVPTNWISASVIAIHNHRTNTKLKEQWQNPLKTQNLSNSSNIDDLYLIVIIGESARYDHMGLLGYHRNTTPLLEKIPNLIGFPGISCNTSTKLSLACMFVREGGVTYSGNPAQQYVHESTVFHTLKETGFSIDLFSMQSEVGFYSTINADSFKIREEIGAEVSQYQKTAIDDVLLINQATASIASNPKGKHIIVLHQKGSHFMYSARYPDQFARFKPECKSIHCGLSKMVNSYDNSILYTDYFLANLINAVNDKKVLMLYASDHGESISEGSRFHATPLEIAPEEQRKVPIIMWASDKFLAETELRERYVAAKIQSQTGKTAKHTQLFETILGCLGFNADNGGIRAENNMCSKDTVSSETLALHNNRQSQKTKPVSASDTLVRYSPESPLL